MSEQHESGVRITRTGNGSVTIEGLSTEEVETLQCAITRGLTWIRADGDGGSRRIVSQSTFEPLPPPNPDSDILPFWDSSDDGKASMQLFRLDNQHVGYASPGIYINHLCGYNYTPERYRENALRVELFGFSPMRSKRGSDGRYWETWYLPGLWAAKGALCDVLYTVRGKPEDERLKTAVDYLARCVAFGSLDVVVQRLAMVADGAEG